MPTTQQRELQKGVAPGTISRHRARAPSLTHATGPRSRMAPAGVLRIPLQSSPVWDIRSSLSRICFRTRRGAAGYPEVKRGPKFRKFGLGRRVSFRHLQGGDVRVCDKCQRERNDHIVLLRCVARKGGRHEGRFIANLSVQSKYWKKGPVRLDSLPEFALEIRQGDHFLSFDMYKGYRHFQLAPAMRDWFIFRYGHRYFQRIALPFGWGRSPLWLNC